MVGVRGAAQPRRLAHHHAGNRAIDRVRREKQRDADDLPERLGGVLTVLFLVFNECYLATGDGDPVRDELTGEAIRPTRILRRLIPEEPEAPGCSLLLLLLTEARREARVRNGQLVPVSGGPPAISDR